MLAYLKDRSAQTSECTATLKQKLQINLAITTNHRILTPGQSVQALTLTKHHAPTSRVPISKSQAGLDWDEGEAALRGGHLTTVPMRLSDGQSGAGIAQSVVCWVYCSAKCSVAGSTLLWASSRGNVSLGVNMISDSIPPKLFQMRV